MSLGLRDTVSAIRHKRLGAIAAGYFRPQTALAASLSHLATMEGAVQLPRSSRIDEVAEKVSECIASRTVSRLARRDWRVVPWVMWRKPYAADQDWFLDALFSLISSQRPLSIIRALTQSYVWYFDADKKSCLRVALFLREHALSPLDTFGSRWLTIDRRFSIFDPNVGPQSLAKHVLASTNVREALGDAGVSADGMDQPLPERAFAIATEAVAHRLRSASEDPSLPRALDQLFAWNTSDAGAVRYTASVGAMATMLLEAVDTSRITDDIKDKLVRYFVGALNDPRLNRSRWANVSERALDVAMRLLVRATLEDFFRIIDATAETRHWQERRRFWLGYYECGAITDAWVAFGPTAVDRANKLEQRYGSLVGSQDRARSALVVRIRDLIVVEMSHNGRCRFFPHDNDRWQPGCYDQRYSYQKLTQSDTYGNYLSHQGAWQAKFARIIFHFTRLRHPRLGAG